MHQKLPTALSATALLLSLGGTSLAADRYLITNRAQIRPGVLASLQGERGPQGPQGPQGTVGSVDWADAYYVGAIAELTPQAPEGDVIVKCNRGDHVLQGGFSTINAIVSESVPDDTLYAGLDWHVHGTLTAGATSGRVVATALCVR